MAASLEGTQSTQQEFEPEPIVAGPKNFGEANAVLKPTGTGTSTGMRRDLEIEHLHRALEDSIKTSLSTDVYRDFTARELLRDPGTYVDCPLAMVRC